MFPSHPVQCSQAGPKQSQIQWEKILPGGGCERHACIPPSLPAQQSSRGHVCACLGAGKGRRGRVCTEGAAAKPWLVGKEVPSSASAAPLHQAARFPARSMPLKAPVTDPRGMTRGNPGTCSPRKAPDLSVLGQGRSPSHERVREQGDTSPAPGSRLPGDAPGRQPLRQLAMQPGAHCLPGTDGEHG